MKTGTAEPSIFQPAAEIDDCLCLVARQAARAVTDFYDLVLSPTKMRATQFILLKVLAAEGAVSQQRLGMALAVAPETMSRRLSALRTAGLIRLCPRGKGKERIYTLTDAGKARLKVAAPYWRRSQARMRNCMSREQWVAAHFFLRLLVKAAHNAETARLPNIG